MTVHSHFKDKDPLSHVMEKRNEGMHSLAECHGTELPGHLSAAADSLRETSVLLLILSIFSMLLSIPLETALKFLLAFSCGWLAWKTGRSAWLGWSRLERLHAVIEQEKFEIENHRPQEREELLALYRTKGFEQPLLDEVVDVLMADQNRLLKVMLEEEMGLSLEAYEHPLKQAFGAALGSFVSAVTCLTVYAFFSFSGILVTSIVLIGMGALISAVYEKTRRIPALIWNLSLCGFAGGIFYLMLKILRFS